LQQVGAYEIESGFKFDLDGHDLILQLLGLVIIIMIMIIIVIVMSLASLEMVTIHEVLPVTRNGEHYD